MLKTAVVSLVAQNKMMCEVGEIVADPELQPPATPQTDTMDLTVRPHPLLPAPQKRVGTPLAGEVTTRNWAKQVQNHIAMFMNISELDAETGLPGKPSRFTFP